MRRSGALSFAVALLFFASAGFAAERLVPSQYGTIQRAINAAVNGDTVIVADGTYTGPGNRDIDFKGKAITVDDEKALEVNMGNHHTNQLRKWNH